MSKINFDKKLPALALVTLSVVIKLSVLRVLRPREVFFERKRKNK